jgi:Zn-dependent peptidase ImmA (M78 family)
MPAVHVPITGSVLAWAIAEAGLTPVQAANRLGLDPNDLSLWIQGEELPPKGEFDKLCRLLGRSESFFFLSTPPVNVPTTASFRNPPGQDDYRPTPDDLKQVRLAENVQQIAKWLAARNEFRFSPITATTAGPTEPIAGRIREWLNWSTATQMRETDYEVLRRLRARLEAQGIIALSLSLGDHGLRGFCLPDSLAPIVTINTKDDTRARLFTYVHECAHLSLGSQSLCRVYPDSNVEQWCDRIAGAVLMPFAELQRYLLDEDAETIISYEQVRKAANKFNVSLRAMAVRLEQIGLGIKGLYDLIDTQASDSSRRGFGRGPAQTRARKRLQRYGEGYVGRLLDAARTGELREADVLDLLQVTRKDYKELHQLLAQGNEQ